MSNPWFTGFPRNNGPNRLNNGLETVLPDSVSNIATTALAGGLVNAASIGVNELGFVGQDGLGQSSISFTVVPTAAGAFSGTFPAGTFRAQVTSTGNTQVIKSFQWSDAAGQGFNGVCVIAANGSGTFSAIATAAANGVIAFDGGNHPRFFKAF